MVLILAAKRLPAGHAIGVDLWSTADQSGNSEQVTLRNAEIEDVSDRIELYTADMRQLPFPDENFDVVTSSLAIHNIRDTQGREQALAEILRVLKVGGTAMIADIMHRNRHSAPSSASSCAVRTGRRLRCPVAAPSPCAARRHVRPHSG